LTDFCNQENHNVAKARHTNCTECDGELDSEESINPRKNIGGAAICDDCYGEQYQDECSRCCERADKTDLDTRLGALIGVWRDAPALGGEIKAGYYRVLKWSFFADGMIEAYFFPHALKRVSDLDEIGLRRAEDAGFFAGPMCGECQGAVTQSLRLSPRAAPRRLRQR
jgi:hypothetical protein